MPRSATNDSTTGSTVSGERQRILSTVLDGVEDLAVRAVEAIWDELPSYAAQDERYREDVVDQLTRHYRTILTTFMEEREVTLDDITFVRGAATRRARAGIAVEDYVSAFRVGQRIIWDAFIECADETPVGHEAALTLVRPLMSYTNFASTHAAHAYVEFEQYVVADADRERRDLLEHLLAGELPRSGPLLSAANAYGISPDSRLLLALAVPAEGALDTDAPQAASAAIARAGLGPLKTLVVVRQTEIIVVAPVAVGADPLAACDRLEAVHTRLSMEGVPLAMGVSSVAHGVAELPNAYGEARAALDCVPDGGVMSLPRLSPFEYLARRADGTARRLIDDRLTAFLEEDRKRGGVLIATVRAFAAADLNLRVAAAQLQLHPNTAQYRIRRIEERAGRNLRHIDDLIDVLVAIAMHDVEPPRR